MPVLKPREELLIGVLLFILGLAGGLEVFAGLFIVPEHLLVAVFLATILPFLFFFSGNMVATGIKRMHKV